MKRPVAHLLFWLVFLLLDAIMHYTWMGPLIPTIPEGEQVLMAFKSAFLLLAPRLMLVYYLVMIGIWKLLNENRNKVWVIAEILLVFVICLVIFRLIYFYYVYPGVYGLSNANSSLLNPRNAIIFLIELGFIAGVATTLKILRIQNRSKEREKNLVKEKLETELKFLRSQTNPHFLFNTLNNIYALARKKSDKTAEVVMKLSELLSFMLYESGKGTITIAEEIKILEDYIDLEKIRYNEKLTIEFNKKIDNNSRTIAPLLLLPLVENAFKHGVSESRFGSFINIELEVRGSRLNFTIENSFEDTKEKSPGHCIGMNNIRRQLELLYLEFTMDVQSQENKFKVLITINLDSYGKV